MSSPLGSLPRIPLLEPFTPTWLFLTPPCPTVFIVLTRNYLAPSILSAPPQREPPLSHALEYPASHGGVWLTVRFLEYFFNTGSLSFNASHNSRRQTLSRPLRRHSPTREADAGCEAEVPAQSPCSVWWAAESPLQRF